MTVLVLYHARLDTGTDCTASIVWCPFLQEAAGGPKKRWDLDRVTALTSLQYLENVRSTPGASKLQNTCSSYLQKGLLKAAFPSRVTSKKKTDVEVLLGCIAALRTAMQPTVTHRVAWSVCLLVCHSSEPCKNGWTDRDAVGFRTRVDPRNHVLHGGCRSGFGLVWVQHGSKSPHVKTQFLGEGHA